MNTFYKNSLSLIVFSLILSSEVSLESVNVVSNNFIESEFHSTSHSISNIETVYEQENLVLYLCHLNPVGFIMGTNNKWVLLPKMWVTGEGKEV